MPDLRPSLRDVALASHVALSTASAALRGRSGIHEETRRRVVKAARRLGYTPDLAARAMRGSRLPMVGVFSLFRGSRPTIEILSGLSAQFSRSDYHMVLFPFQDKPSETRLLRESLRQRSLSAVVVVHPNAIALPALGEAVREGIPVATVEFKYPGAHSVTVDNAAGGRLAADYLAKGGRNFLVVAGSHQGPLGDARLGNFFGRLSSLGIPPAQIQIRKVRGSSVEEGRRLARGLPLRKGRPLGIFSCWGDLVALGLCQGLMARGFRPLRDFRLVGYDGLSEALQSSPAITTVFQPLAGMGEEAGKLIQESLRGLLSGPRDIILQPRIIRGGTG